MRKRCLTVQSSVKINFDKSNHHRTNLFIEAEPRISGTRSCCINCCLLLLVAPSPPRPRWPTHITGKWGQRAGKESSVHGLSHRDLLEWGHADRNLFIGGYCNLALYIILPFLYFQIFVYIFIPLLLWEILSKRIPSFHAGSGNTFFRSFRGIRLWDNL